MDLLVPGVEFSSQVVHTDVGALNGVLGGTEAQTDILVPAAVGANLLGLGLGLRVKEDVRLLLESALRLDGQLGRHGCGVLVDGEAVVELRMKRLAGLVWTFEVEEDSLSARTVVCGH